MKKVLTLAVFCLYFMACSSDKKEAATEAAAAEPAVAETPVKPAPAVILDMSLTEPVKQSLIAFTTGDIDGMTANYADNVRYGWSNGDSLIGKQAVKDYYTKRRALIDTISYSDYIFLPVQVNEAQSSYAPTGTWILYWTYAHVKYKNGKKLDFWLHQVNHYNESGKIDIASNMLTGVRSWQHQNDTIILSNKRRNYMRRFFFATKRHINMPYLWYRQVCSQIIHCI